MIKTAVLSATILTAGLAGVATAQPTSEPTPVPLPASVNRPCPTEDSFNCYWNAKEQGDGHGHSFVVRLVPGRSKMVCVFYVERRYAKSHDYCEATR